MSTAVLDANTESGYVERLLAAARRTIAEVRYCWVVSAAEDGSANARLVLPFAADPEDDEWTRWFMTNRFSRKAGELRRSGRITLAYQDNSGNDYVTLAGRVALVENYWRPGWDAIFPAGTDLSRMIAVKAEIERIEIHSRGVTPEPFGHGRTLVGRDASGVWRLVD